MAKRSARKTKSVKSNVGKAKPKRVRTATKSAGAKQPAVSRHDLPLEEQLRALMAKLKPAHEDLLGIGLGRRHRGKDQALEPETTIRLIVRKKYTRSAKGNAARLPRGSKRFAKTYPLYLRVLGQPVRVDVPTDVGERVATGPMGFKVKGARAAAFAVWQNAEGEVLGGVISCAHGMVGVGTAVGIETGDSTKPARGEVHLMADQKGDRADIALIRITDPADYARMVDAAENEIADTPTAHDITRLLGSQADGLEAGSRYWDGHKDGLLAVAFYADYPFTNPGIGEFTLDNIVELSDQAIQPPSFIKGRSGSVMAGDAGKDHPWLLGTLSQATADGKVAFAYHFLSGLEWLARQPNVRQLEWCFTADKFRRLLADRLAGG